jgi:hypothetical protein
LCAANGPLSPHRPNTLDASAMRWQVVDKLHYKLLGAWGVVAGPHGEGNYGAPTPELPSVARQMSGHTDDPPPKGGGTERLLLAEIKIMSAKAKALVVGPGGDSAHVASTLRCTPSGYCCWRCGNPASRPGRASRSGRSRRKNSAMFSSDLPSRRRSGPETVGPLP